MEPVKKTFKNKILKTGELAKYGFSPLGEAPSGSASDVENCGKAAVFGYEEEILDGAFRAEVRITAPFVNRLTNTSDYFVEAKLFDSFTGDEYAPLFIDSYQGKYVGRVRQEFQDLLERIALSCFKDDNERPLAWIIPANPKHYDIRMGFENSPDGTLTWTQRIKAQDGDTLFIYHTEPIASLTYRCKVVEANIMVDPDVGDGFTKGKLVMRIKKEEEYPAGKFPRSFLNEHGIKKTVRGQRSCPDELYYAVMS